MPRANTLRPDYPDRPWARVAAILDTHHFAITGGKDAGMQGGERIVVGPTEPSPVTDPSDGTIIGYLIRPKASGHVEYVADRFAVVSTYVPVAHTLYAAVPGGIDVGDWVFREGELPVAP